MVCKKGDTAALGGKKSKKKSGRASPGRRWQQTEEGVGRLGTRPSPRGGRGHPEGFPVTQPPLTSSEPNPAAPADREPELGAQGVWASAPADGAVRGLSGVCLAGAASCRGKLKPRENSDQLRAAQAGLFLCQPSPFPTPRLQGPDLRTAQDSSVNSSGQVLSWTQDWGSRAPTPPAPPAPAPPLRTPLFLWTPCALPGPPLGLTE